MKLCILGNGLTSLSLAKCLVNLGISVVIFPTKKNLDQDRSRTIGVSKKNLDFFNKKIEVIKQYKSQFYDPNSNETDTVISSKSFFESIEYRAKDLGRQTFCDYAEGFITHQLPKVNFLNDIK